MSNFYGSNVFLTYFANVCYCSADRRNGKTVPVENGKIFVKVRGWKAGDEYPTYEDLETFLYFLDKCAFQNLGCHAFAKFMRNNPNKTLVDKLTSQDVAYEYASDDSDDESELEDGEFPENPKVKRRRRV